MALGLGRAPSHVDPKTGQLSTKAIAVYSQRSHLALSMAFVFVVALTLLQMVSGTIVRGARGGRGLLSCKLSIVC